MSVVDKVIRHYAWERFEALARMVRCGLQQHDASGIYADDLGHRTIWDEYRYEVNEGPTDPLETAWALTLQPFLAHAVKNLSDWEKRLLFIATNAGAAFDDQSEALPPIDDEVLMEEVLGQLKQLAITDYRPRN